MLIWQDKEELVCMLEAHELQKVEDKTYVASGTYHFKKVFRSSLTRGRSGHLLESKRQIATSYISCYKQRSTTPGELWVLEATKSIPKSGTIFQPIDLVTWKPASSE